MMEETGTVVELKSKNIASVLCQKSSFCQNCAAMDSCQIGDDNTAKLVDAHNHLGAQIGDRVKLVTKTKSFLQSSFILYIVPLISLVIGALLGQLMAENEMPGSDPNKLSAILGLAFLAASFLVIKFACRSLSPAAFMPQIVGIIPEDGSSAGMLQNER